MPLGFGLLRCWEFNEGSGANTTDSTTNQDVASLQGGAAWTTGKVGAAAIQCSAVDGWIDTGTVFSFTGAGSVAWWHRPVTAFNSATTRPMIHQYTAATSPFFDVEVFSDNNIYAGFYGAGQTTDRVSVANSAAYWTSGVWNHWALTWVENGSTILYNNGVQIGSQPACTVNWGSSSFRVGKLGGIGTFTGSAFDQVAVWNRVLNASEVGQLYNNNAGLPFASWSSGLTSSQLSLTDLTLFG